MMSLWDALRMNMMISYQELVRTFLSSLQSAKEKTTVLQDLRKICTPQASLSDEAWEKLMLSDENNKQHIREAIVAMERNNQSNYWEALGKVECPDM